MRRNEERETMPIRIIIEAEDGLPGIEPGETRLGIRLQSSKSVDVTPREMHLLKFIVAEFQESQLRYGRMNGSVRTTCALTDAPKGDGPAR